jgi:hypothetical protein
MDTFMVSSNCIRMQNSLPFSPVFPDKTQHKLSAVHEFWCGLCAMGKQKATKCGMI